MSKKHKPLWRHQREAYEFARLSYSQGHRICTIIGRQGCGKTMMSVAIGASLSEDGVLEIADGSSLPIKGVVFSAPLDTIVEGFAKHTHIEIPPGVGRGRKIDVTEWWTNAILADGRIQKVDDDTQRAWFRSTWRQTPFLALSHHALRIRLLSLPEALRGFLLVLDEAHHAPPAGTLKATVTGDLRDSWLERGGLVLQTTATPWHNEGQTLVYRREDPFYQISSTDLARNGIGPRRFGVHREMLPYTVETFREWLDPHAVDIRNLTKAYQALVRTWQEMSRPVVLIRHPDNKHVPALRAAFEKAGARVFDATGRHLSAEQMKRLSAEQVLENYDERSMDVILASRRFDEGTDLASISTVFYLGSPTSLRHIMQVFGRTMRDKKAIANYPREHVDKSTLVFFVPKAPREVLDQYRNLHHEDIIAIAAYLADYEVGYEVFDTLSERLKASFVRNREPSAETSKNDALLQRFILTEHDLHRAKVEVRKIMAQIAAERECTIHKIPLHAVAAAIAALPQSRKRAHLELAFSLEASDSIPEIGARITETIEELLEEIHQDNLDIAAGERQLRKHLHEIVTEIATKWNRLTTIGMNPRVLSILSSFTGEDADQIADEIRRRALTRPTRSSVARAVRTYMSMNGQKFPTRRSGDAAPYGLKGFTWGQVQRAWSSYHLPGDSLEEYGRHHVKLR